LQVVRAAPRGEGRASVAWQFTVRRRLRAAPWRFCPVARAAWHMPLHCNAARCSDAGLPRHRPLRLCRVALPGWVVGSSLAVVATWLVCGYCVIATWLPRGCRVVAAWVWVLSVARARTAARKTVTPRAYTQPSESPSHGSRPSACTRTPHSRGTRGLRLARSGVFRGAPQVFRGAPQVFRGAPQVFRGAPKYSGGYPKREVSNVGARRIGRFRDFAPEGSGAGPRRKMFVDRHGALRPGRAATMRMLAYGHSETRA
jgi:hypothetical protein